MAMTIQKMKSILTMNLTEELTVIGTIYLMMKSLVWTNLTGLILTRRHVFDHTRHSDLLKWLKVAHWVRDLSCVSATAITW